MKSKKITVLVLVMIFLGNLLTDVLDVRALETNADDNYVIEQSEEITDTELLIERAKAGINEIETNEAANVDVNCIVPFSVEDGTFQTYITSQCINRAVKDGNIVETYAVNLLSVYESSQTSSPAKYGETTLKSTAYFDCVVGRTEIAFKYSQAVITGSGSYTSLIMQSRVYTGWIDNKTYNASKPIPFPTGINTMTAPYTDYISDYPAYIAVEDMLNFSDGTSIYTSLSVKPY